MTDRERALEIATYLVKDPASQRWSWSQVIDYLADALLEARAEEAEHARHSFERASWSQAAIDGLLKRRAVELRAQKSSATQEREGERKR